MKRQIWKLEVLTVLCVITLALCAGCATQKLSHATSKEDLAIAVQAMAAKDCGCGECAGKGCKPCHGKNCYYCVAKGLVTTECGCGECTAKGCQSCGPGCDVCKFNLAPVANAKKLQANQR